MLAPFFLFSFLNESCISSLISAKKVEYNEIIYPIWKGYFDYFNIFSAEQNAPLAEANKMQWVLSVRWYQYARIFWLTLHPQKFLSFFFSKLFESILKGVVGGGFFCYSICRRRISFLLRLLYVHKHSALHYACKCFMSNAKKLECLLKMH